MKTLMKLLPLAVSLLLISSAAVFFSCKSSHEKQKEKMAEEALENASGGKTDVDIDGDKVKIEGENYKAEVNVKGSTWPENMPAEVPRFDFGTIEHTTASTTDGTQNWGVFYKGVVPGSLEKYDVLLKKNGFKTMKIAMGNQGNVTGEKGKLLVTLTIGEDNTHLGVQLRKEE